MQCRSSDSSFWQVYHTWRPKGKYDLIKTQVEVSQHSYQIEWGENQYSYQIEWGKSQYSYQIKWGENQYSYIKFNGVNKTKYQ